MYSALRTAFIAGVLIMAGPCGWANLTIAIHQGVDKPYPIAIPKFKGAQLPTADLLSQVTDSDLKRSGRFLPLKQISTTLPSSMRDFTWQPWKAKYPYLDYVLLGHVTGGGTDFGITFQLHSQLQDQSVVSQKLKHIAPDRLRTVGHYIANQVYQAITGQPGDFLTHIAYVKTIDNHGHLAYELVVADQDGHHPRVILRQDNLPISSPAWSHDGQSLAYVSYYRNRMAIFRIQLATGHRSLLTNYPGLNTAPAFSPKGGELAVALSQPNNSRTDLFLLNLKTQKMQQLTDRGSNTSPEFSSDGQHLLYTSTVHGSPQIYELDLNTQRSQQMTRRGVANFEAKYVPHSRDIVLMHRGVSGGPVTIDVFDPKQHVFTPLTKGPLDKSPSISPNGSAVLYTSQQNSHSELKEVSIQNQIDYTLPNFGGMAKTPVWSPFSTL